MSDTKPANILSKVPGGALIFVQYAAYFGESFGPFFPKCVLPSYAIALSYAGLEAYREADLCHKNEKNIVDAIKTGASTLLRQSLFSVFIPGGLIRMIVSTNTRVFSSESLVKRIHPAVLKGSPTIIALSAIPFINLGMDELTESMKDNNVKKQI
jgi:hypothetical protein